MQHVRSKQGVETQHPGSKYFSFHTGRGRKTENYCFCMVGPFYVGHFYRIPNVFSKNAPGRNAQDIYDYFVFMALK